MALGGGGGGDYRALLDELRFSDALEQKEGEWEVLSDEPEVLLAF